MPGLGGSALSRDGCHHRPIEEVGPPLADSWWAGDQAVKEDKEDLNRHMKECKWQVASRPYGCSSCRSHQVSEAAVQDVGVVQKYGVKRSNGSFVHTRDRTPLQSTAHLQI